MKYFDTFTGIGGFTLAIQQAYEDYNMGRVTSPSKTKNRRDKPMSKHGDGYGWGTNADCIGYSEIDKYAIQVYEKKFREHKNYGDISKINTETLPDFDILMGGFPCQAFSIAGKRGGFNDTRGTLFFEIARILNAKRPRLLLLENVKGLLSHDGGRTFATIIATLDELGYNVEWQVLNSKNFGVPQNRERVFIIGYLGGFPGRKVFPITDSNPNDLKELTKRQSQGFRTSDTSGIATTQASQAGGLGAKTGLYAILTPDRIIKRQNGRRIKDEGEPSFTLTKTDIHGILISPTIRTACKQITHGKPSWEIIPDGTRIRRLTPKECERLQGFPDNWTEYGINGKISDTQRYKMCGNAVTVNVVREIIKRLIQCQTK
jgi:DNA (cytosine-5)-methyltransferase 1